jgi:hypothetical protein
MGNHSEKLTDDEVARVAMRITMSTFAQLQSERSTMDETELLKTYIRMCPYVSQDSAAVQAALKGLSEVDDVPQLNPESRASFRGTDFTNRDDSQLGEKKAKHTRVFKTEKAVLTKPGRSSFLGSLFSLTGFVARVIFLDFALALFLAAYLAALWTHRLHDLYLYPQMKALVWDDDRMYDESTYYKRYCDERDMSTLNGADLFLPSHATADEAYEHQLRHGMTIFPNVLSDETATNLRNYVRSRNFNLTDEQSIFVISNKNRYSFGLGTEEPPVTAAMMELASNKHLRPALEKVLGPNPALIEMTAITSTYGAKAQYWHDDVVARASPIQFAQSFGPSYSVFVQLQNTTKDMGATSACPGTHFCCNGDMDTFCEEMGFQVVGEDGFWRAGDAMLMNMNIWHRGAVRN